MSAPVEWRLGEIFGVDVHRGMPTSRTSTDGQYPVFSIAALRNDDAPTRFVDRDEMDPYGADGAYVDDVLVAIEGGTVGEAMVVTRDMGPFVPSQQVAVIRLGNPPAHRPLVPVRLAELRRGTASIDGLRPRSRYPADRHQGLDAD